jgi:hypothetical protein
MPNFDLSYEKAIFHRIPHHSGRNSIEPECAKSKRGLIATIVETVKDRPGEAFLFFTFKNNRPEMVNCSEVLKKALNNADIDTEAVDESGKKLYNWLTLGNETASNDFAHCKNVIFLGLMHLSDEVLRGKILSQMRDVTKQLDKDFVTAIQKAELCYAIHQGACRSGMRLIQDDVAGQANIWYTYHNDSLQPMLDKVFRGAQWKTHRGNGLKPKTKAEQLEGLIIEYLASLRGDSKVSNRAIKKVVESKLAFGRNLFTQAIRAVSNNPETPWVSKGQSMVKSR